MRRILILLFVGSALTTAFGQSVRKTENIVLITLDGMRWQEVFGGADSSLMKQQKAIKDGQVKRKFWDNDLVTRRKMLFPFLWTTVAERGQLIGSRGVGSKANVTNNQWFSYPGYNELLTGAADNDRIHSNDKFYNPNTNVLEFINGQSQFAGKVAAFTSWDVFPFIINDKRSGVFVSAGLIEATGPNVSVGEQMLNQLMPVVPNPLGDVRLDAFTFYYGMEYIKRNKPRVMYFAFDETDDFAHQGEYAAYLNSARNTDQFISALYGYLQSDPVYKDKTTLIITVDHGRGNGADDWNSHGIQINGADQIWMAILGPDTPARGEVKNTQHYQNQIAQTMAALLGLRYESKNTTGKVLDGVMK